MRGAPVSGVVRATFITDSYVGPSGGGIMGFFDEMASKAVSGLGGSSSPGASTILEMINNQPGGLSGLVQRFHEKGLGGL